MVAETDTSQEVQMLARDTLAMFTGKGARVLTVAHSPLPFQPVFGSSMRPSIPLA